MKPTLLAVCALIAVGFASAAHAREVKQTTADYEISYAYPPVVNAHPVLLRRIEADLARQRAKLKREAGAWRAETKAGGFPFHPYSWEQTWQVVTDLPGWLSLSASYWSYSGGSHGMGWSGAMLYDKRAKVVREPLALFTSTAALSAAIRRPFCAALDRQRAEKRGEAVKPGSTGMFDECIDPAKQTVLLGSRGRKAFDRIGVLVAPYEAGPYVEGSYEATLPVTPAVLAAVRPEFRGSFAVGR